MRYTIGEYTLEQGPGSDQGTFYITKRSTDGTTEVATMNYVAFMSAVDGLFEAWKKGGRSDEWRKYKNVQMSMISGGL